MAVEEGDHLMNIRPANAEEVVEVLLQAQAEEAGVPLEYLAEAAASGAQVICP